MRGSRGGGPTRQEGAGGGAGCCGPRGNRLGRVRREKPRTGCSELSTGELGQASVSLPAAVLMVADGLQAGGQPQAFLRLDAGGQGRGQLGAASDGQQEMTLLSSRDHDRPGSPGPESRGRVKFPLRSRTQLPAPGLGLLQTQDKTESGRVSPGPSHNKEPGVAFS